MTNARAVLGASSEEIAALSNQIKDMGANAREGPQSVANAYYDIVSGVADASTHMAILENAIKTSEAGAAGLGGTTAALVSIMNSYGLAAEDAAAVSDVLTQTVGMGVLTMDELAASIPNVTGLASSLDVQFSELGGAMAFLTTRGFGASQAATQLQASMVSLINPNETMKAALSELGVASGDLLVKQLGLVGALEAVAGSNTVAEEGLARTLGSVEALNAVLALTADGSEDFLAQFEESMEGATDAAQKIQLESTAAQLDLMNAALQVMRIEIGTALIPAVSNLVQAIKPLVLGFAAFAREHPGLIASIGKIVALLGGVASALIVVGTVIGPITTAWAALAPITGALGVSIGALMGPIGLVIGGLAALAYAYKQNFLGISDAISHIGDTWQLLTTGDFKRGMFGGLSEDSEVVSNVLSVRDAVLDLNATIKDITGFSFEDILPDFSSLETKIEEALASIGIDLDIDFSSLKEKIISTIESLPFGDKILTFLGLKDSIENSLHEVSASRGLDMSQFKTGLMGRLNEIPFDDLVLDFSGLKTPVETAVKGITSRDGVDMSEFKTGLQGRLNEIPYDDLVLDFTGLKTSITTGLQNIARADWSFDWLPFKDRVVGDVNEIDYAASDFDQQSLFDAMNNSIRLSAAGAGFGSGTAFLVKPLEYALIASINEMVIDETQLTIGGKVTTAIERVIGDISFRATTFGELSKSLATSVRDAIADALGASVSREQIDLSTVDWTPIGEAVAEHALDAIVVALPILFGGPTGLVIGIARLTALAFVADFMGFKTALEEAGIVDAIKAGTDYVMESINTLLSPGGGGGAKKIGGLMAGFEIDSETVSPVVEALKRVQEVVEPVGKWVVETAEPLATGLADLSVGIAGFFLAFEGTEVKGFLYAIAAFAVGTKFLIEAATDVIGETMTAMGTMLPPLGAAISDFITAISRTLELDFAGAALKLFEGTTSLSAAFAQLDASVGTKLVLIAAGLMSVKLVIGLVSPAFSLFAGVITGLASAIMAVITGIAAFLGISVGWIIAILAIGALIIILATNVGGLRDRIYEFIEATLGFSIPQVWEDFKQLVSDIAGIITYIVNSISGNTINAPNAFAGAAPVSGEEIASQMGAAPEGMEYYQTKGGSWSLRPKSQDTGGYGFANMPYLIGRGAQPELFIPRTAGMFVPAGQYAFLGDQGFGVQSRGSGGQQPVIINYSPIISTADEREVEFALKPIVERIMRGR